MSPRPTRRAVILGAAGIQLAVRGAAAREPLPADLLLSEDFLPEHLGDLVR